jgi:hypothetical protein
MAWVEVHQHALAPEVRDALVAHRQLGLSHVGRLDDAGQAEPCSAKIVPGRHGQLVLGAA